MTLALAKTKTPAAKITISLARSAFGNPVPTITLTHPKGTSYRVAKAALLRLAATIEESTPSSERWIVEVAGHHGAVYLELMDATEAEAARGLAHLRSCTGA